jgi:hypothetical protein
MNIQVDVNSNETIYGIENEGYIPKGHRDGVKRILSFIVLLKYGYTFVELVTNQKARINMVNEAKLILLYLDLDASSIDC